MDERKEHSSPESGKRDENKRSLVRALTLDDSLCIQVIEGSDWMTMQVFEQLWSFSNVEANEVVLVHQEVEVQDISQNNEMLRAKIKEDLQVKFCGRIMVMAHENDTKDQVTIIRAYAYILDTFHQENIVLLSIQLQLKTIESCAATGSAQKHNGYHYLRLTARNTDPIDENSLRSFVRLVQDQLQPKELSEPPPAPHAAKKVNSRNEKDTPQEKKQFDNTDTHHESISNTTESDEWSARNSDTQSQVEYDCPSKLSAAENSAPQQLLRRRDTTRVRSNTMRYACSRGIVMEGYLIKRVEDVLKKEGTAIAKRPTDSSWKICYCVLEGNVLGFYSCKNDFMKNVGVLGRIVVKSVRKETIDRKAFGFCIQSEGHSVHHFGARSEFELKQWLRSIEIEIRNSSPSSTRSTIRPSFASAALDVTTFYSLLKELVLEERNDFTSLFVMIHPDVKVTTNYTSVVPFWGQYRRYDGFLLYMSSLLESVEVQSFDVESVDRMTNVDSDSNSDANPARLSPKSVVHVVRGREKFFLKKRKPGAEQATEDTRKVTQTWKHYLELDQKGRLIRWHIEGDATAMSIAFDNCAKGHGLRLMLPGEEYFTPAQIPPGVFHIQVVKAEGLRSMYSTNSQPDLLRIYPYVRCIIEEGRLSDRTHDGLMSMKGCQEESTREEVKVEKRKKTRKSMRSTVERPSQIDLRPNVQSPSLQTFPQGPSAQQESSTENNHTSKSTQSKCSSSEENNSLFSFRKIRFWRGVRRVTGLSSQYATSKYGDPSGSVTHILKNPRSKKALDNKENGKSNPSEELTEYSWHSLLDIHFPGTFSGHSFYLRVEVYNSRFLLSDEILGVCKINLSAYLSRFYYDAETQARLCLPKWYNLSDQFNDCKEWWAPPSAYCGRVQLCIQFSAKSQKFIPNVDTRTAVKSLSALNTVPPAIPASTTSTEGREIDFPAYVSSRRSVSYPEQALMQHGIELLPNVMERSHKIVNAPSRYESIKSLGTGAYGEVLAAYDTVLGRNVAIKKMTSVLHVLLDAKRVLREIHLLKQLRHAHVIGFYDLFQDSDRVNEQGTGKLEQHDDSTSTSATATKSESVDTFYMVCELMETDLHRIIHSTQTLSDDHIAFILFQLLSAVKYIHSLGVIHRDIKPSNILLNTSDCTLKLCDFGLARVLKKKDRTTKDEGCSKEEELLTEYVVTRWYRSPEILLEGKYYDEKIDIWSIGCILAELLGRKPFFPGTSTINQLQRIFLVLGTLQSSFVSTVRNPAAKEWLLRQEKHRRVGFEVFFPDAHPYVIDLMEKLLVIDPKARFSAAEALNHPYFERFSSVFDQSDEPLGEIQDLHENVDITKEGIWAAFRTELQYFREINM